MNGKFSYYDKDFILLLGLKSNMKYRNNFIVNRVRRHLYNRDLTNMNPEFFSLIYDLIKKKNNNKFVVKTWIDFINNINNINNTNNTSNINNIPENVTTDVSGNIISNINNIPENVTTYVSGNILSNINNNVNIDISENVTTDISGNNLVTTSGYVGNVTTNNYNLLPMESIYNILSSNFVNNNSTSSPFESKYTRIYSYITKMCTIFEYTKEPLYNLNYYNKGKVIKEIFI